MDKYARIKEKILLGEDIYGMVSVKARYLLMVLINRQTYFVDEDNNPCWFFCRMFWLSKILCVKRNQIYKYKKELEDLKIIETTVERDKKGERITYFKINPDCLV